MSNTPQALKQTLACHPAPPTVDQSNVNFIIILTIQHEIYQSFFVQDPPHSVLTSNGRHHCSVVIANHEWLWCTSYLLFTELENVSNRRDYIELPMVVLNIHGFYNGRLDSLRGFESVPKLDCNRVGLSVTLPICADHCYTAGYKSEFRYFSLLSFYTLRILWTALLSDRCRVCQVH